MARRGGAVPALVIALALGLGACGGIGPPSSSLPAGATGPAPASTDPTSAGNVDNAPTRSGETSSAPVVATGGPATGGPAIVGEVDIARLATGETPTGWVEIRSNDDACRQAVPPDWVDSGLPGHVLSPEIHVTSIVANDTIAGWDEHVAYLQATYFTDGQEVVLENDRLFLLRSTERGGASHVLALRGSAKSCGIVLAIDGAGVGQYASVGVQILYSLAEIE